MATISSITAKTNYLHVAFGGTYDHLRNLDDLAEQILRATNTHACRRLLLDLTKTSGLDEISTIEEHTLAEFVQKIFAYSFRVAFLFPKLSTNPGTMIGAHLENVAVNRGVQLRVFWQLEDAVSWITRTDDHSKEVLSHEETTDCE